MNMSSLENPFKFEILIKPTESYHMNREHRLSSKTIKIYQQ